jgi:hypothetical protein
VRLWDPTTGRPIGKPLTGHTRRGVDSLVFSPNGKLLATAGLDSHRRPRQYGATVGPALLSEPLVRICSSFGSPTAEEWQQYAPGTAATHGVPVTQHAKPPILWTSNQPRIGTNVSRTTATEDRKSAADLEPEGGFEPPTCRLPGHRNPETVSKGGRVAQLTKLNRQGRNDSLKDETLAETLAEQSRLSGTSCQFRLPDLRSRGLLKASRCAKANSTCRSPVRR